MFLDTTGQVIIALKCVAQQPQDVESSVIFEIEHSIKLATNYLKSEITCSNDFLWIGNKYSTPLGLSALRVVNGSLPIGIEK